MTKDGYTMKGNSRQGKLIGTSPFGCSRMVVDVMSYRKPRGWGGQLIAEDTRPDFVKSGLRPKEEEEVQMQVLEMFSE